MSNPIITIITATYCARDSIEITANSIRKQTYKNIQWIVIDGGSKDGTVEWLEENRTLIDYYISEPDNGIYDAWNKALSHSRGEWVQFLGAGDYLASSNAIELMSKELEKSYPKNLLVYGNIQYVSSQSGSAIETIVQPWDSIKTKWELFHPKLPVHPEVFHHKELFAKCGLFSTKYKIAGDSHFLLKAIKITTPRHVNLLIDIMPVGGISWSFVSVAMIKEIFRINQELGIKVPIKHLLLESAKVILKSIASNVLGKQLAYSIADCIRTLEGKPKRWTVR